jgi:GntR family transcriptional regulator
MMARNKIFVDPTPVYYKLQTEIQKKIENGRWAPGQRILAERTLAENYKVSIGTVKKALLNLVHEGYLYRIQGKGTFVAGTTLRPESLRYYRFLRNFTDDEADLKIKLLELKRINGRQPHNRYLKIRPHQNLYELKRLFFHKQIPIVYSISYLPQKLFKNLHEFPIHLFEKVTLYEALEKKYGVPTIYNQQLFGATLTDTMTAKLLRIENGKAILFIEMLSFTYKDKPYEYRKSYCVTDGRKVFTEI